MIREYHSHLTYTLTRPDPHLSETLKEATNTNAVSVSDSFQLNLTFLEVFTQHFRVLQYCVLIDQYLPRHYLNQCELPQRIRVCEGCCTLTINAHDQTQ